MLSDSPGVLYDRPGSVRHVDGHGDSSIWVQRQCEPCRDIGAAHRRNRIVGHESHQRNQRSHPDCEQFRPSRNGCVNHHRHLRHPDRHHHSDLGSSMRQASRFRRAARTSARAAQAHRMSTFTPEDGFTGSVNLAVTGVPSGVTASFSPNPTTGSSMLTLTASSTATPGTTTLTITGTSGSLSATTTFTSGSLCAGLHALGGQRIYWPGHFRHNRMSMCTRNMDSTATLILR